MGGACGRITMLANASSKLLLACVLVSSVESQQLRTSCEMVASWQQNK
jgi:hypothetical protein